MYPLISEWETKCLDNIGKKLILDMPSFNLNVLCFSLIMNVPVSQNH